MLERDKMYQGWAGTRKALRSISGNRKWRTNDRIGWNCSKITNTDDRL
jgi:hypothetical protein